MASTRAQATWNKIAAVTPSARARSRSAGQGGGQLQPGALRGPPVGVHVQKAERGRGLRHVAEQAGEVPLEVPPRGAQPGLRDEVAERQRRGQAAGLTVQDRGDLAERHFQAGVVQQQVLHLDQAQPAGSARLGCHQGAQQRGTGQVDPRLGRGEQLADGVLCRDEGDLQHRQHRLAPDHLDRLGQSLPGDRGAVDVVPVDHLLQGGQERVEPAAGVEPQRVGLQVGIGAAGGHEVVEEQALLQRCQRVDVGEVGRSALHPGHDLPDLLGGEVGEGEHGGGDDPGVVGDLPWRDGEGRGCGGGGEAGRGGGGEQGLDRDRDVLLAQVLDERDREEGVAAEFEEAVVGADVVQAEDGGEGGAQEVLAGGGGGPAAGGGGGAGGGQGGLVDLAVGGQGQRVEDHDRGGQHVPGQPRRGVLARRAGQPGPAGAGGGDQVAGQPRAARAAGAGGDRGGGHAGAGGQDRLDLTGLDPEPADLDLVISAAGELQHPARPGLPRPAQLAPARPAPGAHRTTSPVRYIRAPGGPNGQATNRPDVSAACRR